MSRYQEALKLRPSEGQKCSTLGELVAFAIDLKRVTRVSVETMKIVEAMRTEKR